MNVRSISTKRLAGICAAGLVLGAAARAADPIGRAGIQAQYEQDVANCKKGTTGQDRSACLRGPAPPARKPIVSACRRARRPSFSRTCWTAAIACRRRPARTASRR